MQSQEKLSPPGTIKILECQKLLGTGSGRYDIPHVLKCFDTSLWVHEENGDLTYELKKLLNNSKYILLREIVVDQVRKTGHFHIESPLKDACRNCSGVGEVYRFARKQKEVKCMKCTGGEIIMVCGKCKGTGKLDVETCSGCKGKTYDKTMNGTQIKFTCPTCRGSMKVRKFAIIEELQSTTPCRYCGGMGIKKPNPERYPDNPVLTKSLGDAIKIADTTPAQFSADVVEPPENDKTSLDASE
jgi:DnaJ-class molecular chaperone